jgi:hypothetical protein
MKRLSGIAGIGAVTATVTLLILQPVSFGRGAPSFFLIVFGGWLFVRGLFLAGAALFAAADDEKGETWRLWLVPFQIVLGFGALYAALWRIDPGSLVGAGLDPPLRRFSVFALTFGAVGGIAPEETSAHLILLAQVAVVSITTGALLRRLHRPTGWVIGGVVAVLVGGIALSFGEERRLRPDFERGITLTGYHRDAYANEEASDALQAARDLGAEWVTIVPAWFQGKAFFHGVGPDPVQTPTDQSIEDIINQAHELGMKVTLKPHVNVLDGTYRGDIKPDNLDEWFRSYEGMISVYADIAKRTGAEQFVVGTELDGVSRETDRWRRVIELVRDRYDGTLTYAANWDDVRNVKFWDALDAIGVDAYYPLGDDPDLGDVIKAWEKPVKQLERLHERYDKDVLLTEIGYPNADSAIETPYEPSGSPNPERQKTAVEAALTVWAEPEWAKGMSWWEWTSEPSKIKLGDRGYVLNEQPAKDVIREWYSD